MSILQKLFIGCFFCVVPNVGTVVWDCAVCGTFLLRLPSTFSYFKLFEGHYFLPIVFTHVGIT